MKRLVKSFGLLMLVVGMMASSLAPTFAQNEPEGTPVATEEVTPGETEVVPTETEVAVPTETEVAPAALQDEGDVEASAIGGGVLNLSTSDGADIPSGSMITFTNITGGGSTVVSSFPLLLTLPSPALIPVIAFPALPANAVMQVDITAAGYLPFSQSYILGNFVFFVSAQLQLAPPTSTVTVGVVMSDNGPIPAGLTWTLFVSGQWVPLQTGSVPAGGTSWSTALPDPVDYGTYQLWITGAGYSSGQVLVVDAPTAGHTFTLDRLIPLAAVSVQITMTDGGLIPDGMTWSLQTADNLYTEIEGGSVPDGSASGWTVPLTNSVPEGSYVLLVQNADQTYFYFYVVGVTAPETTLVVNFDRILDPTPTPTDVPTETPTVAPTDVPTETPTVAPTETATVAPTDVPTVAPTAAPTKAAASTTVTSLPNTGQGAAASTGTSSALLALMAAVMLFGTAGAVGFRYRRNHR